MQPLFLLIDFNFWYPITQPNPPNKLSANYHTITIKQTKMNRLLLLFFLLVTTIPLLAQEPSSCSIPDELRQAYDQDVKGLVIKRMQSLNSPELTSSIEIPQIWQDSIMEGLAAIYNLSPTLPQADSVFNRYCVHDNFSSPVSYGMIIGVDPESSIAQAWDAGQTTTGNTIVDNLLADYNFTVQNYFSFGAAVFQSDKLVNIFAISDSLTSSVPAISYAEPDYLIGGAGRIQYATIETGARIYTFFYEWNDCFDGCDNYYSWQFEVRPDCSVLFLGTDTDGFFGIEPLPAPVNCMLMSDIETPDHHNRQLRLYPNPAKTQLFFSNAPPNGQWQMLDSTGKHIATGHFQSGSIEVSGLPKGIYFLKWQNREGQWGIERFVKG
jgi:hypothetical protein